MKRLSLSCRRNGDGIVIAIGNARFSGPTEGLKAECIAAGL
ncbi:hypothetical protein EKH55_4605 [Sinorhizobium alkalisoli]|nr:hypothetical protein EKH55_4605 [Sinorhizobium alkalisoli]